MKTIFISGAVLAMLLLGGGLVFAQVEEPPARIPRDIETPGELISAIEVITDWIFVIFLLFSVLFVLLAAFQFVAGGGDPGAVGQARQRLIWAGVGILVAVMARAIPFVITNIFGVTAPG